MAIQYANITKLENDLTDIADAIRRKDEKLNFPEDYIDGINNNLFTILDFANASKPIGSLTTDLLFSGQYDHSNLFQNRNKITELIFTNSKYIPASICQGVTSLINVKADKCITIGNNAFNGCTNLGPNLAFPNANGQNTNTFYGCIKLAIIDFGGQSTGPWFSQGSFNSCTNLSILILRNTNRIFSLSNINTFQNTPFASGKSGGILYVPQNLIDSYKNATNWSTILSYTKTDGETLQNQILPIEGSEWETKYGDGRLIADVNLST